MRRQRLATAGPGLAAMGPVDRVAGEHGGRIGPNLDRLLRINAQYDPERFFRVHQSL